MKVLFYLPLEKMEFDDNTTVSVRFEHLARNCNEARCWLHKNEAAIMAHGQELFSEAVKNCTDPVMRQFIGLNFSYEACYVINGSDFDLDYPQNLTDAPNSIAMATESDFIHGEVDKQAIIRFADQLHRNATDTSIRLLTEADMFGAKLTEKTLMALKGDAAEKVTAAIGILQNKPSKALETAYVIPEDFNTEDVFMRCWPMKKELQDIYDDPEQYAIATVNFSDRYENE